MEDLVFAILSPILVFGAIAAAVVFFLSSGCEARWRDAGFPARWQLSQGCQVQVLGRWVPESTIRIKS